MNRSMCRAMMGVAGLAVLGMTATLADGIVVEYEIDREMIHTNDSRAQLHFSFVMPSAEGLDEFRASLGAALDESSLIGPAFGSMMVNFTPQADFVKVNATYK